MKKDYSCGIVPYRVVNARREYLLVQHHAGHWAFPKGHPEDSESPLETATRELAEETGLDKVEVTASPAFEEVYKFTKRSGKRVRKVVTYFLGEVSADAPVTVQEKEIADHRWGDVQATRNQLTFEEGKLLLDEVEAYLVEIAV